MSLAEPLTLYTAKVCPYAHRVEIALAEVGTKDFQRFEIDLQNKPQWYQPKINPASKVPAVAYGGPTAPPDQPSPSSTKIAESLVLLEFVADLFPNSTLLPKNPVLRAQARFFIETFSSKFVPANYAFVGGRSTNGAEGIFAGIEAIQALLPAEGFAIGDGKDFTIADAAIAPFLGRLEVALKNDQIPSHEGEGRKAWEELQTAPRFERFGKYWELVKSRESFKSTFDEEYLRQQYEIRLKKAGGAKA